MTLNHVMLGAFLHDELIGVTAWRYGIFNPSDLVPFPNNFDQFANSPNTSEFNAAYVYNFVLLPDIRKTRLGVNTGLSLIAKGIDILIADGCKYLVGASRCPSYSGSSDGSIRGKSSNTLKSAVDDPDRTHIDSKIGLQIPWQEDPVLSFYKHALGCIFLRILPGFMPEDLASGGYAIGFYKVLE